MQAAKREPAFPTDCRSSLGGTDIQLLRPVSPDLGGDSRAGNPSIANIRFQPYRLTGSKCYDPDDARISCLACHNPHHDVGAAARELRREMPGCHRRGKNRARRPVRLRKTMCVLPHAEDRTAGSALQIYRSSHPDSETQ